MELNIRDVSKTYSNGVQALRNVSLTIPAGMFGLLGPNGAGKSSALAELEREHAVISTRLLAGRTVVRVLGDAAPGPGFAPAEPELQDVYFGTMAGHVGRRRARPEVPA